MYSDEFKGVICEKCHKQMKITQTIPVVFHNLKGYDSTYVIKRNYPNFNNKKLNVNSFKYAKIYIF